MDKLPGANIFPVDKDAKHFRRSNFKSPSGSFNSHLILSVTKDHTIGTPIEVTTHQETTETTTPRMGDREVIREGITMIGAAERIIVEGERMVRVLTRGDWKK